MRIAWVRHALRGAGDVARTELWPVPALAVAAAIALGIEVPRIDGRFDSRLPGALHGYLFGGDGDAARTFLSAIAGSLITVTSLTFSLTVVTLQLASSQFSPRLLRTFTKDRFVHVNLALFLATFVYALTVLRSVRSPGTGQSLFVPKIAVTIAFLLALASTVGLVLFLAHLAQEIRVETMLKRVRDSGRDTIRRCLPSIDPSSAASTTGPPPPTARPMFAHRSGVLVKIDEAALLRAATDAGAVVLLDTPRGSPVVAGAPFAAAWPCEGEAFEPDTWDRLVQDVQQSLEVGFERTEAEDVGYGLRQLADVAVKALSPGINDPTTAVSALGHLSALLAELAGRELGPRVRTADDGRARVELVGPTFADLLDVAVTQSRHYGARDPFVLATLFALLRDAAWNARQEAHRAAISEHLGRLRTTVIAADFDAPERQRLEHLDRQVGFALERHWVPESNAP